MSEYDDLLDRLERATEVERVELARRLDATLNDDLRALARNWRHSGYSDLSRRIHQNLADDLEMVIDDEATPEEEGRDG